MSPARTVGETIRLAREERGLSRQEVSSETRIADSILEKIEEDRFSELPGDLYTRNYIRILATFLDLDAVDLVTLLRSDSSSGGGTTADPAVWREDEVPITQIRTRQSKWGLWLTLALAVIIAGLGIAWWQEWIQIELGNRDGGGEDTELAVSPVENQPETETGSDDHPLTDQSQSDGETDPSRVDGEQTSPEPAAEREEQPPPDPDPVAHTFTTPPMFRVGEIPPATAEGVPATLRLEITATGSSRIQVNIDDRRHLARSFQGEGGSWILEGYEFIILSASEIDNLQFELNGEEYTLPVGSRGRVQACRIDLLGPRTGS